MAVGLRQVCVLSPWLFNFLMDGAIKVWKARIMNACVCLDEREGRQCRVSSFLFADDVVMISDGEEC